MSITNLRRSFLLGNLRRGPDKKNSEIRKSPKVYLCNTDLANLIGDNYISRP